MIPMATFYWGDDPLDITVTPVSDINDDIKLHVELPDAVFGFKLADIDFNKLTIEHREGFTDEEMSEIIDICRRMHNTILKIATRGIVYA